MKNKKLIIIYFVCFLSMMISGCSINKKAITTSSLIDKTEIETTKEEKKDNTYNNVIQIDTSKTDFINIIITEKQTVTIDSMGIKTTINEKRTEYNNEKKENYIYNEKKDSTINENIKGITIQKNNIENENTVKTETTTKTKSFFWYYVLIIAVILCYLFRKNLFKWIIYLFKKI